MLALLLLLSKACLTESRSLGDDVLSFTIVHMNDIHANFDEVNINVGRCHTEQAEAGKCFGGMGRMYTAVRDLVNEDPDNTLLLNAGDYFQGTMWFSELGYEPVATFGNMMNWTAMGLGNHDFDRAVGGLANFSNLATFDLLAANMVQNETDADQIKFNPSKVVEIKGTKIGLIGYVTTVTPNITASPIPTITFLDEIESVRKEARRLQSEEGVEILIALGHAGYILDLKMAQEIEEIDLVVGGHSHSFLYTGQPTEDMIELVEGEFPTYVQQAGGKVVPVVQVYKYSKYLGVLNLNFNTTGDFILPVNGSGLSRAEVITIDKNFEKNPWIEAQLDEYREKLSEYYPAIGNSTVLLEKIENQESNIGNLVTDAMVRNSRWNDTKIAFQNNGGIRGTIDPGEITGEDVIQVLPFGNTIDRVTITGKNIRNLLEDYVSYLCPNQTCDPPTFLVMSGLKVVYDIYEDPLKQRVTSVKERCEDDSDSWCDIDDEKIYPVALLSFLAQGGSKLFNFPDFIEDHQIGDLDYNALKQFIEENSPISYEVEGRITINYHQEVCFEPGICLGSFLLDQIHVDSPNDCLESCKESSQCQWFSFFPDIPSCSLFANCENLDVEDCPSCLTGQKHCQSQLYCDIEAQCLGTFVHIEKSESYNACLLACQSKPTCEWFTWNSMDGACSQFEDCAISVDDSCQTCTSGQKDCHVQEL